MTQIPSYETVTARFRDNLARLDPASAYEALLQATHPLLLCARTTDSSPFDTMLARGPDVIYSLNAAYRAYEAGDSARTRQLAEELIARAETLDPSSLADAMHLLGRVQYDAGQVAAAEQTCLDLLDRCCKSGYAEGYARALHEISRIKEKCYQYLDAEAGFRIAADYYAVRLLGQAGELDPVNERLVRQNLEVALRCLSSLADNYLLIADGPTEGDQLIESLSSELLKAADGSGDDFLMIRSLSLKMLTTCDPERSAVDMIAKALALYATRRELSVFALDEAVCHAKRQGVSFPEKIRDILAREHPHTLRAHPPCATASAAVQEPPLRHLTADDAADSIQSLYEYLAAMDGDGRYVYRGQTQEYDAPLFPSAMRPIFKTDYGVAFQRASGTGYPHRLRGCGASFAGEYNYCFSRYADVMWKERAGRMKKEKIERIFGVYRQLLESPIWPRLQDRDQFIPWAEVVEQQLSKPERKIYRHHADEWNVRIDNFHRRTFRNDILVRLFGYTLGTTFAQQFGLSSEGLDATKSLAVACFFASRDSVDFQRVPKKGLGVLYRFPFPPNDVATRPLAELNFYNLPSIIDVEDVFYRFEQEQIEQPDAMSCMIAYVKSRLAYHAGSTDTLILPRGFLASSRIAAQRAVIIMPDEIRADLEDREPGVDGIRFPKFRFVEDLKTRQGLTRFYFRHTGHGVEGDRAISREQLWPREDYLLKTLVLLFAGSYPLSMAIPKRLELIDGGYSPQEFLAHVAGLYTKYRHSFLTPDAAMIKNNFFTEII